jgi:hypothetical protein
MPMKKSHFTEEQIAYATEAGGDRNRGDRSVPSDGRKRADLLSLGRSGLL